MNFKIPVKYKVPLQGEYNAMINPCPNIDCDYIKGHESLEWFIGLTDDFIICECPKCFTKWYYHHKNNNTILLLLELAELNPKK